MDPILEHSLAINRREFFSRGASALGTAALASLLARDGLASATAAGPAGGWRGLPHFAPRTGGGTKPGVSYGASDDLAMNVAEGRI